MSGERRVGVLTISRISDPRPYRRTDLARASVLATQILLAVENAALIRRTIDAERLATVGQLAAGVAHEINNPIGYVRSNLHSLDAYLGRVFEVLELYERAESAIADAAILSRIAAVKESTELDYVKHDVFDLLHESREGISRVTTIVQDLKNFSRLDAGGSEWSWADLHEGLDSTINIVMNEIKYKAELVRRYGTLPPVECVPSELNQVFMNMLVNAAQAMTQPGTITVSTGCDGAQVSVEIADTGEGIAPEHLARIFDPFFTTKPVGKGTGLGLALSYGIVQKHHGRIDVTSERGRGTSFRVTLPVTQQDRRPQELSA
jgi:signal transduction histidine kinase